MLSPERLQGVVDFMSYLYERECWEATEELEDIPGFVEDLSEPKSKLKIMMLFGLRISDAMKESDEKR